MISVKRFSLNEGLHINIMKKINNTHKTKLYKTACTILIMPLLLLSTPAIISHGENISFSPNKDYTHWCEYLSAAAVNEFPYAFAFIQAKDTSADLSWEFYDDMEAFTKDFFQKKEHTINNIEENENTDWYFVKLRIDDELHATDIYEYMQQNLSDEGYRYMACTLDNGNAYNICQINISAYEDEYTILAKSEAVVCDGYMYLLSCMEADEDNLENINELLVNFETQFHNGEFRTGAAIDEEELYWSDHEQRITRLDNPTRTFTEKRAVDTNYFDNKIMSYFGLMSEAEYQINLAPDMPEMKITFRFGQEIPQTGYSAYLLNGYVMDETYKMEIRSAKDNRLLQITDVKLCIDRTDTIAFEDINNDGYLEMCIAYSDYWSGIDESSIHHTDYWTWDKNKEKLVVTTYEELTADTEPVQIGANNLPLYQSNNDGISITVVKGDCLWKLASAYYGDGCKWNKIYEANSYAIGDNPSLIYEGTVLNLPDLE